LKDRDDSIIADGYADASILFADIAGYTKRASDTDPADLVFFLNQLYTDFDVLTDCRACAMISLPSWSRDLS